MQLNTIIEVVGTVLGLIYLYYQYIASPRLWWACLVSAIPMIYLNFNAGLFATGLLYTYYFIMAVKALYFDRQADNKGKVLSIQSVPLSTYPRIVLGVVLIFLFLFFAHRTAFYGLFAYLEIPQKTMPIGTMIADCFATTLCFLGMWLLSKTYLEQWYAWLFANLAFIYMFLSAEMFPLMGMMIFYSVMSLIGLLNWKKLKRQQAATV